MFILESLSRTDVILLLFVLLIIFVFITLAYLVYNQKKQDGIVSQSLLDEKMEKIHKEEEDIPIEKEEESAIVSLNDLPIKKIDSEDKDIETITRELENLPREISFEMTPYEKVQEEKAIISYDELVKQKENSSIAYHEDSISSDDVSVKQVDLDKTGMLELDPVKKELNTKVSLGSYKHEEEFLESLKDLSDVLE